MKLKTIGKGLDYFPDYDGDGFFVEGARDPQEALEFLELNEEQDKGRWEAEHGTLMNLHTCLDCDQSWSHDGDFCCGECGAYRLSKKYKEMYYFC
jgi:hypothetical protein